MGPTSDAASEAPVLAPGRTAATALAIALLTALVQALTSQAIAGDGTEADLGLPDRSQAQAFAAGLLAGAVAGSLALGLALRGRAPRTYLALGAPSVASVAIVVALALAWMAVHDAIAGLVGEPIVPDAWRDALHDAPLPLLVLALVVAAPLFEEAFFRGFLFAGLARSRLGPTGASVMVAALFTLSHFPDSPLRALDVAMSALLLSASRQRTGSLWPGIAAHAAGNLKVLLTLAWLG